jgi:hypothetical protein
MPEFDSILEYCDVSGFPGYRVGSDGSVWSCRESIRGTRLSERWHRLSPVLRRGYPRVGLWKNSKLYWRSVHKLVLEAFVGLRPVGMECCHRDGTKTNNSLDNIRWDTSAGNAADKAALGRIVRGSRHRSARLTEADIPDILLRVRAGESQRSVARSYGISHGSIGLIICGKGWAHVPR